MVRSRKQHFPLGGESRKMKVPKSPEAVMRKHGGGKEGDSAKMGKVWHGQSFHL